MKQIQETVETGQEIIEFVVGKMQTENSVHVGTLVSAFARLSGTSLLRSFFHILRISYTYLRLEMAHSHIMHSLSCKRVPPAMLL